MVSGVQLTISDLYFTNERSRAAISGTTPVSYNNLTGNISFLPPIVRIVTSTDSVLTTDRYLIGDSSSALSLNLPAATIDGQVYIFKNKNTGTVSIVPNGTDTIDGVNTSITMAHNVSYSLFSAGGAWYIW